MGDNTTRHSQRAAAGLTKAIRQDFAPPDTRIMGPDGTLRILGRRTASMDPVVAFHKFNPTRRDARTGKRSKSGASGKTSLRRESKPAILPFGRSTRVGADGNRGVFEGLIRRPMNLLGRIPLMNMLVTAALAHRVWSFVTRRFFGGSSNGGRAAAQSGDRQLARRAGDYEYYDDDGDEDYLDEAAEQLLGQVQHASMLPTMLRSSLPRPHRNSLAKRAAQQYHSRPRGYRTAHQMMHGGPTAGGPDCAREASSSGVGGKAGQPTIGEGRRQAQRRTLGKLEKMDLIVRQQVRAAMLAQQRQEELLLQQNLEPGPQGAGSSYGTRPGALHTSGSLAGLTRCSVPSNAESQLQQNPNSMPALGGPIPLAMSTAAPGVFLPPPRRLLQGLPAPPAFRPLPPELQARLHASRHPGTAAMEPAARAAATGSPRSAQLLCTNNISNVAEAAALSRGFSGSDATAESGTARGQSQSPGQDEQTVYRPTVGDSEDSEDRIVVPRVARAVRFSTRTGDGGAEA